MPNSLPNNAAGETDHTNENRSMNLDLLRENMFISIKIKVWNHNLNVLGILIIMFETKTLFFIKIEFNGHVTCSFTIMNRKWAIGEHF